MPKPERGRIIWAELLDPQGRNRKCRPAMIITATEEIQAGGPIVVVGISTELGQSPAKDQVALPWERKPKGNPKTGLKGPCVAVCTWLAEIQEADIKDYAGVVPGKQLLLIQQKVDALSP